MPKTTLRRVIDEAIEEAFFSGARWALMWHAGIGSPEVTRVVKEIRQTRSTTEVKLIQQPARENIARAIMEAAIEQTSITQERLWLEGGKDG